MESLETLSLGSVNLVWSKEEISKKLGRERLISAPEILLDASRAISRLRTSGVLIVPTDTLYALAVRVQDEQALEKLFRLKGRSLERQIPVFVEDPEKNLTQLVSHVSDVAWQLIENFWPGPLMLVLPAKPGLSRLITGNTQSVGVRQSAHPVIRTLINTLGEPITGTSANLSGAVSPFQLEQISPTLLAQVDLVVDDGTLMGRKGSTILDLTGSEIKILRQGDLPLSQIREVIQL